MRACPARTHARTHAQNPTTAAATLAEALSIAEAQGQGRAAANTLSTGLGLGGSSSQAFSAALAQATTRGYGLQGILPSEWGSNGKGRRLGRTCVSGKRWSADVVLAWCTHTRADVSPGLLSGIPGLQFGGGQGGFGGRRDDDRDFRRDGRPGEGRGGSGFGGGTGFFGPGR